LVLFRPARRCALCVLALSPNSTTPTIGASGAIFGLLVAFAMVFPEAVIYLYLWFCESLAGRRLFAFIEFFAGLSGGGTGLGRFAHLGGMATGICICGRETSSLEDLASHFAACASGCAKVPSFGKRRPVVFHEITDDLVKEVDAILRKNPSRRRRQPHARKTDYGAVLETQTLEMCLRCYC